MAHQVWTEQVRHQHLLPCVDAHVVDRRGHVDRRVVHDHVEIADDFARIVHGLQHGRLVAHVERTADRLHAVPRKALRDGRRAVAVEIRDDDVRTVAREFLADRFAEPAAAARDECGAAGERQLSWIVGPVHMYLPVGVRRTSSERLS